MILGILYHWPLIVPQLAWNVRLRRRTGGLELDILQCRSKHSNGPENAPRYAFQEPQMKHFLGREHCLFLRPSPMRRGTPSYF